MAVAEAIADVESNGSGGYTAISTETKYGHAYGKYQVLRTNIGKWTRQAVGRALTPQEFLNDSEAQDLTAGLVIDKLLQFYEPKEVAVIWFTGEPNPPEGIEDAYGTTPSEYQKEFAYHY